MGTMKLRDARERLEELQEAETGLRERLGQAEQALGRALAEGGGDPDRLRNECGQLRSEAEATRHAVAHLEREIPALEAQGEAARGAEADRIAAEAEAELWANFDELEEDARRVLEDLADIAERTTKALRAAAEAERRADALNGRRPSIEARVSFRFRKRYEALIRVRGFMAGGAAQVATPAAEPASEAGREALRRLGLSR